MAKRYCYHFTKDPAAVNEISAEDLYEANIAGPDDKCDTITDLKRTEEFARALGNAQLFRVVELENFDKEPGWALDTRTAENLKLGKETYFYKKFSRFRGLAPQLSLDEFMDPESRVMSELVDILTHPHGSLVAVDNHLGLSFKSLDKFIRELEPGQTWYLSGYCVVFD